MDLLGLLPKGSENRRRDIQTSETPAPVGRKRVAQHVEPAGRSSCAMLARKCWVQKERALSLAPQASAQRSGAP